MPDVFSSSGQFLTRNKITNSLVIYFFEIKIRCFWMFSCIRILNIELLPRVALVLSGKYKREVLPFYAGKPEV